MPHLSGGQVPETPGGMTFFRFVIALVASVCTFLAVLIASVVTFSMLIPHTHANEALLLLLMMGGLVPAWFSAVAVGKGITGKAHHKAAQALARERIVPGERRESDFATLTQDQSTTGKGPQ